MALIVKDRVKETTTTTGTGALILAGAMTGFRAFSSVCSTNDTCYYALQAVDSNGTPTGDWEVGLGTYSGTNTLTRTTVLSSSNSGSAVSLSSGTKQVWIDIAASDYLTTRTNAAGGPAFSARATSNQTISNNTRTKVLFDSEDYDTASCYSSSRFTPNVAGYYQINAAVTMGTNAAYLSLFIYKNGTAFKIGMQSGSNVESGEASCISGMVFLNGSTDYVEIYLSQGSGSSVTTFAAGASPTYETVWSDGCLVRPA
jgi:hypothetical protein